MSDSKLVMLGAALTATAAATGVPPVILGAPAPLLLAAYAGALFSLAQTPPEKWGSLVTVPRTLKGWQRYLALLGRGAGIMFTVTSVAFVAAWGVALSPHVVDKLKDAPLAPAAGILAYGFQLIVPRAFNAIGKRIDAWGGKPVAPAAEEPGRE